MTGKTTLVLLTAFAIAIVFACVILTLVQWNELDVQFPPEHVYIDSVSPDGSRIALFSVKFQATFLGLTDVEPHSYITIIGTGHGEVLVRKTEYHGQLRTDFIELAKKYAPWAVEQVALGIGSS
jgi:hypothetical protein